MLKKLTLIVFIGLSLSSCNKMYNQAMKSTDKDQIYTIANQLYNDGKYTQAIELYDRISTSFVGTEKAADIAYNTADANYKDENYKLAGHLFKNFAGSNPMDKRSDEALYLSAFSYYQDSPKFNLDQTSTYTAIDELQNFINTFPDSEHVSDANKYITELRQKLELKAYEIAKVYYKTMKYKAAAVAFDNMIDEYPDSKFREEAMIYSLRSKAELAINFSRLENKDLRLQEARTQYRQFNKYYPTSSFKNEADKLLKNIEEDLQKTRVALDQAEQAKKNAIASINK